MTIKELLNFINENEIDENAEIIIDLKRLKNFDGDYFPLDNLSDLTLSVDYDLCIKI